MRLPLSTASSPVDNPVQPEKDKTVFVASLAVAVLVGFFLRNYLLKDQIFADDEWHGFYYAIGKSPFWLFTHFSIPGATCIPLNLYGWALGVTFGWSEILLRLPSLICGILCVLVCPLLARDLIGTRRAAWLALLLAVSPQLIFYSRISRPYSAVAFFGFASILYAARWAQFGGWRSAILFVITGILAVYFHLFAVVTVVAPILAAIIYHLYLRLSGKTAQWVSPPLQVWLIAGAVIAVASAVLLLPAMIYSMRSTFFTIALAGTFRLQSLPRVVMFLAGSAQLLVMLLFLAAVLAGAIQQCRRNPWFGWMLVSLYPLHVVALLISRPDAAQSAVVLVRYSIQLVPVSLLFAACGIQAALEAIAARVAFRPILQTSIAFACVAALVLAGPLPQAYATPNNFTSHGAYQHRYEPIDWSHSFSSDMAPIGYNVRTAMRADEVSPFYKMLRNEPGDRPIVEYPMLIGDHFNPLYYYQYFHRRPVIVGYAMDVLTAKGLAAGNIYGNTYIDQVLSFTTLFHEESRLHFRNLVSMEDLNTMRARHVEYIVIHKHYEAELPEVALPLPEAFGFYTEYRKKIGPPFYEDGNIAVFKL